MERVEGRSYGTFVAGFAAGALAAVLYEALRPRRGFDPTLLGAHDDTPVPPVVIVPGILGSQLVDAQGREAWLGLGNMVGAHDIALPAKLPLEAARDRLMPGGLLGVDHILPRLFGFSEYGDLVAVLEGAGFVREPSGWGAGVNPAPVPRGLRRQRSASAPRPATGRSYSVYSYDWRRDLVESARGLGRYLERLAHDRGTPDARFTVIGHSMGGLVARLHLRFGTDDPTGPVTWGGASRIARLVLATAPNGGSLPALEALLNGSPVGFSTTTLAASVCATFPSLYALLPPPAVRPLLGAGGAPLAIDLLDPATWAQHGWGAFAAGGDTDRREYARAALLRARDVRAGLDRAPETPCPVPVVLLGGDTLPTLARGVLNGRGVPRFVPENRRETALLYEAGDGRVTRASLLASHVEAAPHDANECGVHEAARLAFGDGDHHGLFSEPGVQSALLRALLARWVPTPG